MTKLKPCPFCGGTNTEIRESKYWTGKSYQILSVTVMHWCDDQKIKSILQRTGKTTEEAIAAWNTRQEEKDDD